MASLGTLFYSPRHSNFLHPHPLLFLAFFLRLLDSCVFLLASCMVYLQTRSARSRSPFCHHKYRKNPKKHIYVYIYVYIEMCVVGWRRLGAAGKNGIYAQFMPHTRILLLQIVLNRYMERFC